MSDTIRMERTAIDWIVFYAGAFSLEVALTLTLTAALNSGTPTAASTAEILRAG